MSDEATRPSAARRVVLVAAAVLIPIVVGSLATVVLYATRPNAGPDQRVSAVTDTEIHDGQVLIIQPQNAERITVPVGQILEVILQTGAGQSVVSDNVTTLVPIATRPCHISAICAVPAADMWTFQAVKAGVVHLKISFGVVACPPADECPQVTQSPMSLNKPVAIFRESPPPADTSAAG